MRKTRTYLLLACLTLAFPLALLGQSNSAAELFLKAERYRKSNNMPVAIQHYDLAIKADPLNYNYHYQKGQCCIAMRDYNCAIKSLEETTRLKRNHVEAYTALSWLYEQQKKYLTSVKELDNAFNHQTDVNKKIEYKMKIIQTLYSVGQFGNSGSHIADAKKITSASNPNYLDLLYYEAKYFNFTKKHEAAKQSMITALKTVRSVESQKIARFYYELGYAYYHLGEYRSAKAAFNYANYGEFRALIAKMTPQYNYAMASAYQSAYLYPQSKELLELCLALDKDYSKARELLRAVGGKINNFSAIQLRIPMVEKEVNPIRKAQRYLEIAEYQLGASKYQEAIAYADKALALQPRYQMAIILQGVANYQLKNYTQAKALLNSVANDRTTDSETRAAASFALGIVSKANGDKRSAIASFKAAQYGNFRYASDKELGEM